MPQVRHEILHEGSWHEVNRFMSWIGGTGYVPCYYCDAIKECYTQSELSIMLSRGTARTRTIYIRETAMLGFGLIADFLKLIRAHLHAGVGVFAVVRHVAVWDGFGYFLVDCIR